MVYDPSRMLLEQFDDVVDLLRHGVRSQVDFYAAIDRHKAAIKDIAMQNVELRKDLREVVDELSFSAAPLNFECSLSDIPELNQRRFDFQLSIQGNRPRWSYVVSSSIENALKKEKIFRRIRWVTYMNFSRLLRKELEVSFHNLMRRKI